MSWNEHKPIDTKKQPIKWKSRMPLGCVVSGACIGLGIDLECATILVPSIVGLFISMVATFIFAVDGEYRK